MEVKRNKLYLYVIIALFSFAFIGEYVNANEYKNYFGITMTNTEYNNLLNLGFSEKEIYYMNEETFNENKNIEATIVAENTKYYKTVYTNLNGDSYSAEITEEEYNNQSMMDPRGTVNTEYKSMVSIITKLTNTFRYKVSVNWNKIPVTKSYDVIGIGFEDPVTISSLLKFSFTYADSNGNYTTSTINNGKQTTSTGGSIVYKIPNSLYSLSTVLYYDVSKATSNTITGLEMCGDYSHATSNVSASTANNHEISINGIELGTSSISYYDAIPCAISTWTGSW